MAERVFEKLFAKNHIPCSSFVKACLIPKFAIRSLINPENAHDVAMLDDLLASFTLPFIKNRMRNDPEGAEILRTKPLLNSDHVDFDSLRRYPRNTLGYAFMKFMDKYGFHSDHREFTHFLDDPTLAYILIRNRQLHDITHVAYGLNINLETETAIKVIEFIQNKLPMPLLAVFGGMIRSPLIRIIASQESGICNHKSWTSITSPIQRIIREKSTQNIEFDGNDTFSIKNSDKTIEYPLSFLVKTLLPWAIKAGLRQKRPMYMVHVEKWFDKPLKDFRRYLGITDIDSSVLKGVLIEDDVL